MIIIYLVVIFILHKIPVMKLSVKKKQQFSHAYFGYQNISVPIVPLFLIGGLIMPPVESGHAAAPEPALAVIQPLDNLDKISSDLTNASRYRAPDEQHKKALEDHEQKREKPVNVTDEEVKNNPQIAEIIIQASIQNRDWKTLQKVLPLYRQSPQHDPMLALYAQGAVYRQQGKHRQAIEQYQNMLEKDASLDYVRFDLGAMLFENRQYRQAEKIFLQTQNNPQVEDNFRILAGQFLAQINKQERTHGKAHLRMVHNDNVNQTTEGRFLNFAGLVFEKTPPIASLGTNYALALEQERNLAGNHFLNWNLSADGLNYASAHDFDEHGLNIDLNYKWQDIKSWFHFGPTLEWRWLNQERYIDTYGVSAGYGRWLSPRWQANLNGRWINKSYKDLNYQIFNGQTFNASSSVMYLLAADTAVFGGLSFQKDDLERKSEGFDQYGVNLGIYKQWANGLNAVSSAQLASRSYGRSLMNRKDQRLNASINIGHKKINFFNVEPKLGFQYDDVDSNIDQFYTRKIQQWTLTFEKKF